MKNLTFFCALMLFFSSFTSVSYSQSVSFKMKRPPLNQLSVSDFYNIDIVNSSNEKIEFYLYGTLTESKAGLIATATTAPVTLGPKERKQFKASDLPRTPDISYPSSDNRYKEALMRKGSLPDGNYTICIYGKQTGTNEEIGNDCIEQEISIQSEAEIVLLTPDNKAKIEFDEPVLFTWLPPMPTVPNTSGQTYKIKIVELKGDESPENAMFKNKAFFEKEGIRATNFQYPTSGPKLESGKKYAWVVISGNVQSKVSIFDRWGNLAPAVTLSSPRNGETVNGDSLIFKWEANNQGSNGPYKILVVIVPINDPPQIDIRKNKAFFEKEGITTTSFQYPLDGPKLEPGKKYAWAVSDGDSVSIPSTFIAGNNTYTGATTVNGGTIKLISPVNGGPVNGDSISFKWELADVDGLGTLRDGNTSTLADVDGLGTYKIKIVELKGDESPENAMLKNKAFFEKEGLTQQLFEYPTDGPKLMPGKKYAWTISYGDSVSTTMTFAVTGGFTNTGTITNNGTINDLKAPTGGDSVMPAKVTFKMKRPPINQLRIGDLLNGTFTNIGEPTTLYIYGSMTNNENGELITDGSMTNNENGELIATFGPISLTVRKAGGHINEYLSETPEINFISKDPKYNSFMNNGDAPAGNYKVCIELRDENNKVVGQDCFIQSISGTVNNGPAKVSFKMKRPPINQLRIGDLLNGTFTNIGEPTTLYVYGSMTNNENGELVTDGSMTNNENGELIATYGPFSLTVRKAGTDILEYLKVNPEINFLSKDKKYDSFRNNGNAPEGNYTVCVELRYTDNTVAGIDCYEQKISGKK